MKQLVVHFCLEHGHQLSVVMVDAAARQVLNAWLVGTLKPRIGEEAVPGPWAVDTAKIMSIQLFDPPPAGVGAPPPGLPAPGTRVPPGTSGVRF